MFKFEKLEIWNEAIQFTDSSSLVTKPFPVDERFGPTTQLRHAAASIAAKMTEGSSRNSSTGLARFVKIACGSLMESLSHLPIARRQSLLNADDYQHINAHAEPVGRMLSGLIQALHRP